MFEHSFGEIVNGLRLGSSIQSIAERLGLNISLLQFAVVNELEDVIEALVNRPDIDFNQPNAAGETIAHHCAEIGDSKALLRLAHWVEVGRVDITARTKIFSNFMHYATHITAADLLAICFSLASEDMLLAQNQLGKSPLSLAIAQDNADFLRAALKAFPKLISLKQSCDGCLMTLCDWLLHEIAGTGAKRCFEVLREHFTEIEWTLLKSYRNQDEEQPIDAAILAGQRTLFQMLKGYRAPNGAPTLQWLSMLEIAANNNSSIPSTYSEMLADAQDEIQQEEMESSCSDSESQDYHPSIDRGLKRL